MEHDSATDSATKRNGDGSQMHVFLERSQTQNSTYMTYLYNILEEARQRDRKKLVVVKGQDAHKRAWKNFLGDGIILFLSVAC